MRRTFVQAIVGAALLGLLAVLATLQYQWVGEVSNAERDRLRTTLRARATEFSRDFDREITRTYLAFRADPELFTKDAASALAEALARSQSESAVGGIIETVYFLEAAGGSAGVLRKLDPAAKTLTAVEWPQEFQTLRTRAVFAARAVGDLPPLFLGDALDARIPALVVSLPAVRRIEGGNGQVAIVHDTDGVTRTAILRLDAQRVRRQLIETLAARHFGSADSSDYFIAVVGRDDPAHPIYASAPTVDLSAQNADVATGMFDLRLEELNRFTKSLPPPAGGRGSITDVKDRVAITIVRRSETADGARVLMAGGDAQGAWQVLVRGKSGSLETLVARSRNRNLAIGLGILGLLAASFVFVIGSAQRQQRLARQQLEFVAAVSHELRTPVAVIRSAGENLADGVVGDVAQVKKYGSLIRTESRRLSDMVERVLEFAGIHSTAVMRTRDGIDLAQVVDEAAAGVTADAKERGVVVALRTASGLPPIVGDPDALRSAVQNVIGNAVKYSPPGGTVEVDADLDSNRLRVVVADHGIGIDPVDLPHVFKPFYRGRRAVDAQVRGTGVGLSVVRHVVDAHQGDVRIESRAGEGTRVVITFPAASRRGGYARDGAAARATT